MFDYIQGTLSYKISTSKGSFLTIEACGIGYNTELMERDFSILPDVGEKIKIYTEFHILKIKPHQDLLEILHLRHLLYHYKYYSHYF